jgi:hypothetical protein
VEPSVSAWIVRSATIAARRGSLRKLCSVREKLGSQGRGRPFDGRNAKGNGSYQDKYRGTDDRIRYGVAGAHGAIILSGDANCVAVALVFLEIATLAVVHWAIGRVAAGRQIGGRKRLDQGREARQKQRQKGRDSCEFAYGRAQF